MTKTPNPPNALRALKLLSRAAPGPADREGYVSDIGAQQNDRGAAILLAANIENHLETCLLRLMRNLGPGDYDDVFGGQGAPANSFGNKITLAYALEIIGPQTKKSLGYVKAVRNAFAHTKVPMSFFTPQVAAVVDEMEDIPFVLSGFITPPILLYPPEMVISEHRKRFQTITDALSHNLFVWAYRAHGEYQAAVVDFGYMEIKRPSPLP